METHQPQTLERARALRQRMTLPEVLLWQKLRGRGLDGLRFRRQHPLGPFIVDFYCDEAKLAVEVDGATHDAADRPDRDVRRGRWLTGLGVRTLRINAREVLQNMDDVLRSIWASARR